MKWTPDALKKLADLARPADREPLGELALEEGLITVGQLDEALREQSAAPGPRLGEILVRKGLLKPHDLARLAERQANETGLRDPGWRYEIRELMGRGATALVYRAWDRELRREVALKVIRHEHIRNAEVVGRTIQEARAAARLSHPNLVAVYDVGEKGELLYVVMELVEGRTLAESMKDENLGLRYHVERLAAVAEAVEHAHQQGVIHRDLKPQNIMIDGKGRPHVMDFGLARMSGADGQQTREGSVIGTPLYMAPEQVRGDTRHTDHRADVYALGATLYQILTRRPPHDAETTEELYHAILTREPAPPRLSNPEVPSDLEVICLKAIEKEPRARYSSAGAMAEDLRRTLRGEPIQARPSTWVYRAGKFMRRHPIQIGLLALSTALAIGLFGVSLALWRGKRAPPPLPPPKDELSMIWLQTAGVRADLRSGRITPRTARTLLERTLQELRGRATPEACYIRGQAHLLLNDDRAAEREAREAIRLDPECGPAWSLLAWIFAERAGRRLLIDEDPVPLSPEWREALTRAARGGSFRWRLHRTPHDQVLQTLARAGQAKWIEKDDKKAAQTLETALRAYGAEEYLNVLGRWAVDESLGLEFQVRALERSPEFIPALLDRATILYRKGDFKGAERDYSLVLRLSAGDALVWANRGTVRLRRQDKAGAVEDLETALALDPSLKPRIAPLLSMARKE